MKSPHKYPPVDPEFYRINHESGMSDDEIIQDWIAFCDELADFCAAHDARYDEAYQ